MLDLINPTGLVVLLIAVLWIATVVKYGRTSPKPRMATTVLPRKEWRCVGRRRLRIGGRALTTGTPRPARAADVLQTVFADVEARLDDEGGAGLSIGAACMA